MKKCLFLVEGPYDKQRLSLLEDLFDENKLIIIPFETDKLQKEKYYLNYEDEIKCLLDREKTYEITDFDFIVQTCDTDGCFIPDDKKIENTSIKHIIYYEDYIEAIDLKSLIANHNYKKENITKLISSNKIRLFYNSTNIDHVFDNKQNPTKDEKKRLAIIMSNKYKDNIDSFIKLLFDVNLSKTYNYTDSWDFIKKENNSLKPTSNLIIFLLENYEELKQDIKQVIDKIKSELESRQ